MKRTLLFSIILLSFGALFAQKDTTFLYKKHRIIIVEQGDDIKVEVFSSSDSVETQLDSAERLLFEGTFGEEYSPDISVNFSFQKMIPFKSKRKKLYPHAGGFSIGFANLSTRNLDIGNTPDAQLQYSSYEIGFQLGNLAVPVSTQHGWLFFTGIGFRYQQFNADFNTAFKVVDNYTRQLPGGDIYYTKSKLSTWHLTVPFMFEWQKKIKRKSLYIQFGVETGVLFYSKSKVKYVEDGNKHKENLDKKLNINPITAEARVGVGIGFFGLYARYGLINFFRSDRGADVIPVSVGFAFNF